MPDPRGECPPTQGRVVNTEEVVAGLGRRLNLVEDSVQVALLQLDTSVIITLPRDGGKGGKGSWALPSLRHEVGGILTSGGFPLKSERYPPRLEWRRCSSHVLPCMLEGKPCRTPSGGGDCEFFRVLRSWRKSARLPSSYW